MNRYHLISDSKFRARAAVVISVMAVGIGFFVSGYRPLESNPPPSKGVMIILRGIANAENPRGQLDDRSAREYARRLGYHGEVLNVAGDASGPQAKMALDRIRRDDQVIAIYGFSGGGFNARRIWSQLDAAERQRLRKVVVIGSPGVTNAHFPGAADVVIKQDPPAGHMAGPRALLNDLDPG